MGTGSGTGPREDASANSLANSLHRLMGLDPLSNEHSEIELVKDGDTLSLRFPLTKGRENSTWAPPAQIHLLRLREEPRRLWWEARLSLEEGPRFWQIQAE